MLTFHIVTLFPELVAGYASESVIGRALAKRLVALATYNPRDYATDRHRTVDDRPYGGGPGMALKAEPVLKAVAAARRRIARRAHAKTVTIILSPRGTQFDTAAAARLERGYSDIILICGRYEGIDARVKKILRARELSVGPYTLTGGELPALIVLDAVARRAPGVLGDDASLEERRAASGEVYTRPETIMHKGKTYRVPATLLSGHHAHIEAWRGTRA